MGASIHITAGPALSSGGPDTASSMGVSVTLPGAAKQPGRMTNTAATLERYRSLGPLESLSLTVTKGSVLPRHLDFIRNNFAGSTRNGPCGTAQSIGDSEKTGSLPELLFSVESMSDLIQSAVTLNDYSERQSAEIGKSLLGNASTITWQVRDMQKGGGCPHTSTVPSTSGRLTRKSRSGPWTLRLPQLCLPVNRRSGVPYYSSVGQNCARVIELARQAGVEDFTLVVPETVSLSSGTFTRLDTLILMGAIEHSLEHRGAEGGLGQSAGMPDIAVLTERDYDRQPSQAGENLAEPDMASQSDRYEVHGEDCACSGCADASSSQGRLERYSIKASPKLSKILCRS